LYTVLNGQQKGTLGRIRGFFRQPEARERLEACKQELRRMAELFKVYQMKCISMHIQIIAGSSYRFNLVTNGANEKECKGTT
jgi:hypothetical protein